jgi:hypothetical protein
MKVYRSGDSQRTHTYLADCLVANGNCVFQTNKFSTFSILDPSDTTPDDFAFTSVSNQEISSPVSSNAVTIVGINAPTSVTATDGQFQIDSTGSWLTNGTVNSGSSITARVTSSSSYSTATTVNITVGTLSKSFTSTTKASTATSGGGGGGGGGGVTSTDSCPN